MNKEKILIIINIIILLSIINISCSNSAKYNIAKKENYSNNKPKRGIYVSELTNNIHYVKKRALVIGINAYPTMQLEAAVADAKAVSERLKELNYDVKMLIDDEATIMRMRKELGTELRHANRNDQVLIYFAGHGVTEHLTKKRLEGYILPVDVKLKDLYSTAISMKELRDLSNRIPAKHLLYVFDCCYSGLGLTRSLKPFSAKMNLQKYIKELSGNRAVYMITAGKKDEVAREVGGHGIFTLHFLEGIAGAADTNDDNIVQASELGRYLAKKVSSVTKGYQNPQHGLLEGKGDFLFPLQTEDPIRLKKSILSNLLLKYKTLMHRKTLQDEFDRIQKMIRFSNIEYQDEYEKEILKIDAQIIEKQKEIEALNKSIIDKTTLDMSRERYSVMKFLNTGSKIDILRVFSDLSEAEKFLSTVFKHKITFKKTEKGYYLPESESESVNILKKLQDANKYPTKIEPIIISSPLLGLEDFEFRCNGLVNYVKITMNTSPNILLNNSQYHAASLQSERSIMIHEIKMVIDDITSNEKLLTFEQVRDKLISRYGQPSLFKDRDERFYWNWKTGKCSKHRDIEWSDDKSKIFLSGGGQYNCDSHHYYRREEINRIVITLTNTTKRDMIKHAYQQALNIIERDSLLYLKKRIEEMAEIERKRTESTSNLSF